MPLQALRAMFEKAGIPTRNSIECAACPVEPATVTPHSHHLLIRKPINPESPRSTGQSAWPESVELLPHIKEANKTCRLHSEEIQGKVKVTAFDYLPTLHSASPPTGTVDLLIFPACSLYTALPESLMPEAIRYDLAKPETTPKPELPAEAAAVRITLTGLTLIVCCHASRDSRCGRLGPPLAAKLNQLLLVNGELGSRVVMSSHVGGHKYAGNILVYSPGHPANGHWFGGLCENKAERFIRSISELEAGSDPAAHKTLRQFWRGKIGMEKEDQQKHFDSLADVEDLAE